MSRTSKSLVSHVSVIALNSPAIVSGPLLVPVQGRMALRSGLFSLSDTLVTSGVVRLFTSSGSAGLVSKLWTILAGETPMFVLLIVRWVRPTLTGDAVAALLTVEFR